MAKGKKQGNAKPVPNQQQANKKKGSGQPSTSSGGGDDDDWEALLEAEAVVAQSKPPIQPVAIPEGGGGGGGGGTTDSGPQEPSKPPPVTLEAAESTGREHDDDNNNDGDIGAVSSSKPAGTAAPPLPRSGQDAAAAFLAAQGLASTGTGGGGNAAAADKNKKKKKKKGAAGGGAADGGGAATTSSSSSSAPAPAGEKVSARGKLVQEALRKQREEEEKRRLAEEAEKRRLEEIEAREREEERLREEEKNRRKQKQKEKIDRQKKEGTYLTKAQKAKAKLAEQRLEAMRAAGMLPPTTTTTTTTTTAATPPSDVDQNDVPNNNTNSNNKQPGKVVYDKRKRGGGSSSSKGPNQPGSGGPSSTKDEVHPDGTGKGSESAGADDDDDWEAESDEAEQDDEKSPPANGEAPALAPTDGDDDEEEDEDGNNAGGGESEDDVEEDWEAIADESDDNMETGKDDKFGKLNARLGKVAGSTELQEQEDLIAFEKQKEQERLRQLGLERAERDRIEAERRAKSEAERAEADHQAAMAARKREEGKTRRLELEKANLAARSPNDLRCPIVVIMGHVDTGKTKLLDKIRKTNVQEGEAGGITQQIGATYFEKKTLETQTARLNATEKVELKVPGMLVIDTPGHESFANLRSRGSSLCDIAILVVDLMHGLEQQTIESLSMLRKREVPFVVALNKIDRCYGWKTAKDAPIREALKIQDEGTLSEFRSRALDAKVQLQEQGVNSNLYWEMGDDDWTNSDFIPLVPTSAITGEGVQDVLLLLCNMAQTRLTQSLMWHANLQATVLEVKAIDGLGMTVDVLVVNGHLREGDKAVFCTLDGPVVTEIRGLLTPPPSREMRIKSEYIHHKDIKGARGVKVIGNNLEKVMAGTPVMVVGPCDEEEDIKAEVMSDLTKLESKLSTDKVGVLVQASTLGALEALLQFLREDTQPPIPVSAIGIGTVHKRDVTKISVMNEKGHPEFATILAFDVEIEREAREHAQEMNVRIMTADIIYHLFDQFTRFMDELNQRRREEAAAIAVFPSIVRILPQHIFNQKNPIILGVEVVEGILKVGTPLCVPALGGLHVGKVESIESNGRQQETVRKGAAVAVKIVNESNPNLTYGRQFDSTHSLYSTLTRASIDALKAHFKDQLETDDWRLVVKLKKVFNII